jgi:hypothetical protein
MGHGSSKTRTWTIVIFALVCGAYLARAPWKVYREQRSHANELLAQAQTDEMQQTSLEKRDADLKSPIGREKLAREHGYLKQGESAVGADTP